MNWIKKRYDQFLLALLGSALLICAVLILLKVKSFPERFTDALASVVPNNKVAPVPLERIDSAKTELEKPHLWTVTAKDLGSLFVSEHYIIGEGGVPEKPAGTSLYKDTLTGNAIPSLWFMDNGLPLLDPTVPLQDPDKDGFTNEDEWRGGTDPNNKESHPPYYTKLFFKQLVQNPFRLVFKAYDGDPKKDPISKFNFQIDTIDFKQPTDFLKLGDQVPHTKYKLDKFEFKEANNPKIQENEDVSELTLVNTETGDKIVLVFNRVINSPDYFGDFYYEWPQPEQVFRVKKLQEFGLRPEVDEKHRYKLIDITATEAQIQLPNGEKYTVKKDPRRSAK